MFRTAATIALLMAIGSSSSTADDVTLRLPPALQKHLADSCGKGEKLVVPASFLTHVDLNSDGSKDYILDYTNVGCNDLGSHFCGTGGCSLVIFFGNKDDATLVLDDLVMAFDIYRHKGFAVVHVQGKYGVATMKLASKRPESLKALPKGGQLVAGNWH